MENAEVIVLFGGMSSERRVSVASAQHLTSILPKADLWFWSQDGSVIKVSSQQLISHQNPYDIDFNPTNSIVVAKNIEEALATLRSEVVYLGLHGGDGENGWIQSKLESKKIPFTGSGSTASKLAMHKSLSKDSVKNKGPLVARQFLFEPSQSGSDGLFQFQQSVGPIVVKPACDGSSSGLAFLKDEIQCRNWFQANKSSSTAWLAEEELLGRELTVGVIMHQGLLAALPPSEVILDRNSHFDFKAKYHGVGNREVTPAELSPTESMMAQQVAIIAHAALGCYGYTRTDMIMTKSGIYYLETNTLPGMTKASFIPQQLRAAHIDLKDFATGQIELARSRYQ